MKDADYWIEKLALGSHPIEGQLNELMRSPEIIEDLPARYAGPRCFYTSIYFLLKSGQKNYLHRLKSDELWYFHTGSPLTIHVIDPGGNYTSLKLGPNPEAGEAFQRMVRAGEWFGATVDETDSYALVGCMVAPGFDMADFELGDRADLLARYPQHAAIIERLTNAHE